MLKQFLIIVTLILIMEVNATEKFIPADNPNLEYSDYAVLEFIATPDKPGRKLARMSRPLLSHKGYNFDNPGARFRFKTNAENITVHLVYSDKHVSKSARQPVGIFYIDGKSQSDWTFRTKSRKTTRQVENVDVKMPVMNDGKFHNYELVMPYGDSVDIAGITVNDDADFSKPSPRPEFKCAIYGDSVTHGFTSSSVDNSYAYKFAMLKEWQVINLGIGGRASTANDGNILGKLKFDVLLVAIGVNDWQGGRPVAAYKKNMENFIKNFRKFHKETPVYLISPLWVADTWKPKNAKYKLADYRKALKEIVDSANDSNLKYIDGLNLINHEVKYFDRVSVHPNDSGFQIMAENLAKQIP